MFVSMFEHVRHKKFAEDGSPQKGSLQKKSSLKKGQFFRNLDQVNKMLSSRMVSF